MINNVHYKGRSYQIGAGNPIDKTFLTQHLTLKRPIENPKFLVSYSGLRHHDSYSSHATNVKRVNKVVQCDMPDTLTNNNFEETLHEVVHYLLTDKYSYELTRDFNENDVPYSKLTGMPTYKFDPSANIRKTSSLSLSPKIKHITLLASYVEEDGLVHGVSVDNLEDYREDRQARCLGSNNNGVTKYLRGRKFKKNRAMGVLTLKLVENYEEKWVRSNAWYWNGNMAKNCIKVLFQLDIINDELFIMYSFQVQEM